MDVKRVFKALMIISLALLLMQCNGGPRRFADKPKKIVPRPKMQAVLRDIHIAEGAAKSERISRDSSDYFVRVYYEAVLKKHDLSHKKYQRSLKYYVENPDVMAPMYKPMMKKLKDRKKALKNAK